jgi:hypothetical protein
VENIPGHRDHHSGAPNQLITISPEWVITIVWNPDHDHPGIGDHDRPESLITIVRNLQNCADLLTPFDLPQGIDDLRCVVCLASASFTSAQRTTSSWLFSTLQLSRFRVLGQLPGSFVGASRRTLCRVAPKIGFRLRLLPYNTPSVCFS